jgi:hypothetical protein
MRGIGNMKDRPQRLDNELEGSAHDVNYEIEMMVESASDIGGVWASPETTLADKHKNMALECFLLHYRNLRAFLCPSLQAPPKEDDILASDFLRKPKAEDVGNKNKIADYKQRLDQMLGHLSYNRHKEYKAQDKIYWYVAKMAVAMLHELDIFLDGIPDYMKPWFPERTMLAKKRVQMEGWALQPTARANSFDPILHIALSRHLPP